MRPVLAIFLLSIICSVNTYGQIALDSLIAQYERLTSSIDKVDLAYEIGKKYVRSDPKQCLQYCEEGIKMAKVLDYVSGEANLINIKATLLYFQGNNDSARILYKRVLELGQQIRDTTIGIRTRANLAMVAQKTGDYTGAAQTYLDLLPILEARGDSILMGNTLSNLGNAYHRLKRYDKNIQYQKEALKWFEAMQFSQGIANAYNSMGVSYEVIDSVEKAVEVYEYSISIKRELGDKFGLANALLNLGSIYSSRFKDYVKSDEIFSELLVIQAQSGNKDGMTIALTNLGTTAFNLKDYNKAIEYQLKAFHLSSEIDAKEVKFNSAKKLGSAYEKVGNYVEALKFFKIYQEELNETFDSKFTSDLAEMESKYQNEKLSKERLEAENRNQALVAQKNQQQIVFVAVLIVILVAGIGYILRRGAIQKRNLALQKSIEQKRRFTAVIKAEENERKRIARELHDGLGQLLSTARLNVSVLEERIENEETKYIDNSLKLIDDAVVEVRNISHNMMPNALIASGLEAAVREQVYLINESGAITVHLSLPEEKMNLEESRAIALYRIIQEVINNALKYAEASNIWIEVEDRNGISLKISDDGKGFDTKLIHTATGIGWENIYSRADILNADLDIKSKVGHGSEISLKIAG